jgi:Mce-associated membrane protein
VVKAALAELHRDRAVVLVFVNQTSTSVTQPEERVTASSVQVTLSRVNGSWLISKFDPV